jgi:NTE family protein
MSKKIRVTLSGSGFRLSAHVGAMAAIEELGYEVVEMSGTSGGAIVAALYAKGFDAKSLQALIIGADFTKLLTFNPMALFKFSYCSGKNLLAFLQILLGKNTLISDLSIPLKVVASDLHNNTQHTFTGAFNAALAVRASAAVPFLYSPVIVNDMWLVDGGICSNTPVELLTDDDVLKLGVKLVPALDTSRVNSAFDVLSRSALLLFENNDKAHIDKERMENALFSFVETGTVGSFDTRLSNDTKDQLYYAGYGKTKRVLLEYEAAQRT